MIGFRFRTIIRPYYRGAAGIVLAYDVTDAKTFQNVEDWITSIYENTQTCQIIQKVLLANKIDLPQGKYLPKQSPIVINLMFRSLAKIRQFFRRLIKLSTHFCHRAARSNP